MHVGTVAEFTTWVGKVQAGQDQLDNLNITYGTRCYPHVQSTGSSLQKCERE